MLRKQATKAGRASSGELWGTKMPPLEKSLTSSQCNKGKGPAMGNLGTGRVTMSVHMFRVLYFEPFINLSSWIAEHVMVKAACPRLFEGPGCHHQAAEPVQEPRIRLSSCFMGCSAE